MSEKDEFYWRVTSRYSGMIDPDLMTAICYALNLTTEEFVSGAYQHCIYDLDIHSTPNHGGVVNTVQVYTDEAKLATKYGKKGLIRGYHSNVILNYLTDMHTNRIVTVKIPTATTLDPDEYVRVFTRLCLYLYGCYGDHPKYRNLTPKQVVDMKDAVEELNQDLHDSGSELIKKVRSHALKNYIIESTVRKDLIACDASAISMMLDFCNEKGYTELTMEILRIMEEAGIREEAKFRL